MANNYTQFATSISGCSREVAEALLNALDEEGPPDTALIDKGGDIILADQESFLDEWVQILCEWQKNFNVKPFGIEVAFTGDKSIPGAFGGACYWFKNGEEEIFGTSEWLNQKLDAEEKEVADAK